MVWLWIRSWYAVVDNYRELLKESVAKLEGELKTVKMELELNETTNKLKVLEGELKEANIKLELQEANTKLEVAKLQWELKEANEKLEFKEANKVTKTLQQ